MWAGMFSVGGVSTTVMVKLPLLLLSSLSVAVLWMVVVPSGKVLPDGGVQTTVGLGSVWSLAVAVKVTTASLGLLASTVMLAGMVRVGALLLGIGGW
jgi:hypothetical protein